MCDTKARHFLVSISLVVVCLAGFPLLMAAGEETGDLSEKFSVLFSKALKADGKDYVALRNEAVAMGDAILPLLEEKRKDDDWHVCLQAKIWEDWVNHHDDYKEFVETWLPKVPVPITRAYKLDMMIDGGKIVAEECAGCPLIVIEKLWKDTEFLASEELGRYYSAYAMYHIDDREAVPLLEENLSHQDYAIRSCAAFALVELGSVRSAPLLIDRAVRYDDWFIWEALRRILDESHLPLLKRAAREHPDMAGKLETVEICISRRAAKKRQEEEAASKETIEEVSPAKPE